MRSRKEALIRSILLENYESYYRLAFSYVHREADAMDIVQEGAYKAMLKANSLQEESFASTWVYRVMINTAKNYLKKYNREYEVLQEENVAAKEDCIEIDLQSAVEKLPLEEKTLIILRFYEDKTLSEIAQIFQENLSTVKSRLYRTLQKLRKELS
ncbi:MAG: sigma-70 family RNA polymerase sigma factor [Lachnospiraceae bacterium]|nr:sigma-70 family RNA polymerase sigma factor [Lachnospiraceae bacterium]